MYCQGRNRRSCSRQSWSEWEWTWGCCCRNSCPWFQPTVSSWRKRCWERRCERLLSKSSDAEIGKKKTRETEQAKRNWRAGLAFRLISSRHRRLGPVLIYLCSLRHCVFCKSGRKTSLHRPLRWHTVTKLRLWKQSTHNSANSLYNLFFIDSNQLNYNLPLVHIVFFSVRIKLKHLNFSFMDKVVRVMICAQISCNGRLVFARCWSWHRCSPFWCACGQNWWAAPSKNANSREQRAGRKTNIWMAHCDSNSCQQGSNSI